MEIAGTDEAFDSDGGVSEIDCDDAAGKKMKVVQTAYMTAKKRLTRRTPPENESRRESERTTKAKPKTICHKNENFVSERECRRKKFKKEGFTMQGSANERPAILKARSKTRCATRALAA